jgi:hypothetical protein
MSEKYFLLDDKARQANGFVHDCTIWKEWKRKLSPMRWLEGSGHSTETSIYHDLYEAFVGEVLFTSQSSE